MTTRTFSRQSFRALRYRAAESMIRCPQYDGHFNDYVAVRIRRDIKTKGGLAFRKGEITIARPQTDVADEYSRWPGTVWRTVWSFIRNVDTSVRERDLEVL